MKVTKYPQSCLLLEKAGAGRILIDPGNFALDAYSLDDFGEVDAVFYTHRHADHFDNRILGDLRERGARLIANPDVAPLLGDDVQGVVDRERFEVAGFDVVARDLPHVPMVDGSPGPPNTGYVVDGAFFHPGDGMEIDDLRAPQLAAPIAGPSISFRDAYRLVETLGASTVVPIHYDMFIADPQLFAHFCDRAEVMALGAGETAELSRAAGG